MAALEAGTVMGQIVGGQLGHHHKGLGQHGHGVVHGGHLGHDLRGLALPLYVDEMCIRDSLHRVEQSLGHLVVVDKVHLGKPQAVGVPLFVGLAAQDRACLLYTSRCV